MSNRFAADYFHPSVPFVYCVVMMLSAMLFMNPFFIAAGVFFSALTNLIYSGPKRLFSQFALGLPLAVFIALFNPLVSHRGGTLLFYLFHVPFTLESLFYGICSGGMLLLIFLWFGVYNRLVPAEKSLYLFSGYIPAASMLLTLTQRMIPLFSRRLTKIRNTQKTLLCDMSQGAPRERVQNALKTTSILMSWSMEDGLDTADSMKARGYGAVKRRSFYSDYHFRKKDAAALILILFLGICCFSGYFIFPKFQFYPYVRYICTGFPFQLSVVSFGLLCLLPASIELHEVMSCR